MFANVEYLCNMTACRILALLFLIALFHSCGLETAKPLRHPSLVLASDCLTSKDSLLFSAFTKKTGIQLHILCLSSNKIKQRLQQEGINTKIDALLLRSSFDALHIEALKLMQKIPADSFPTELNSRYRSRKQSFAGIGFDPYIIVRRKEASSLRNYASLLSSEGYATDLTDASSIGSFYLFLFHKHADAKTSSAVSWIEDMKEKCVKKLYDKDTLLYAQLLFTKRSSFLNKKNTLFMNYKDGEVIYPNQRIGGTYYDMPCFGIVKQARNYSNALQMMNYLVSVKGNQRVNKRLQTVSFYEVSRNKRFKRYFISPLRLENYFPEINQLFY